MALRGVRSSWETRATNSSLSLLSRSASVRAARSLTSSASTLALDALELADILGLHDHRSPCDWNRDGARRQQNVGRGSPSLRRRDRLASVHRGSAGSHFRQGTLLFGHGATIGSAVDQRMGAFEGLDLCEGVASYRFGGGIHEDASPGVVFGEDGDGCVVSNGPGQRELLGEGVLGPAALGERHLQLAGSRGHLGLKEARLRP